MACTKLRRTPIIFHFKECIFVFIVIFIVTRCLIHSYIHIRNVTDMENEYFKDGERSVETRDNETNSWIWGQLPVWKSPLIMPPVDDSHLWAWKPVSTWQQHFEEEFAKKAIDGIVPIKSESINCPKDFPKSLQENLNVIEKYTYDVDPAISEFLMIDDAGVSKLSSLDMVQNRPFPVIVTGASSRFYPQLQAFFQNIHEVLMNNNTYSVKVIFYDLGLTVKQKAKIQKYCKCEYRTFPSEKFPDYVGKGGGYAWKPVIIQMVLKEYDLVFWTDTSIRFFTSDLDFHVKNVKRVGIHLINGGGKVYQRTKKITFDKLGEKEPCLFGYPEIQAGFTLISRNPFTMKYIMKPWVSCALTKDCMVIKGNVLYCRGKKEYHRCHRFDQSVLSIIILRLFGSMRDVIRFVPQEHKFADVIRNKRSTYIDNLEKHDRTKAKH